MSPLARLLVRRAEDFRPAAESASDAGAWPASWSAPGPVVGRSGVVRTTSSESKMTFSVSFSSASSCVGSSSSAPSACRSAFRVSPPRFVRGGAHAVAGEVYEVDALTLARLDALEGHPRFYRRTRIALEDGTVVETYLLPPEQVEGRPVIASGNWRSRRKETAA
jgi:gamma-glutamylcyclotransferase (GGCT)/AIG2-like uncharacterized protein YtfP